jgi:hypothetical protein
VLCKKSKKKTSTILIRDCARYEELTVVEVVEQEASIIRRERERENCFCGVWGAGPSHLIYR